jgi:hypothetical protein
VIVKDIVPPPHCDSARLQAAIKRQLQVMDIERIGQKRRLKQPVILSLP